MSFSLSSLLNPSPSAGSSDVKPEGADNESQQPASTSQQDEQPFIQSPEQLHASLPKYEPPQRAGRPPPVSNTDVSSSSLSIGQTVPTESLSTVERLSKMSTTAADQPSVTGDKMDLSDSLENKHTVITSEQAEADTEPLVSQANIQAHSFGLDGAVISTIKDTAQIDAQRPARSPPILQHAHQSVVEIKQEKVASPSPLDTQRAVDMDKETSKSIASIKQDFASRTQSPLRESATAQDLPQAAKKKRAPAKPRKGMATNTKKPRAPTRKRKPDVKSALKDANVNSSPTPSDAHSYGDVQSDDESSADSNEDVEGSGDVYCLCRKPDNGTFMIGCDGNCDDWFHGKCVGIEEKDKSLLDQYMCPNCESNGLGRTSWKRICRRPGCRQAARVGKTAIKTGVTSKYCSDECGVLFFRQMTSTSRGQDGRKRRKTSLDSPTNEGARGGVLSIAEAKAMLDQSDNAAIFRDLGNGVLSPPATPAASQDPAEIMNEMEKTALQQISDRKEQARNRHQVLKDRLKFVGYVKAAATKATTEKELKSKDYCGFDVRLEWSEEEFAEWRTSAQGQKAFELEDIDPAKIGPPYDNTISHAQDDAICSRKKCARHHEWSKLAVDEIRFEMTDNSNRMRILEQDEKDIKERVAIRAKTQALGQSDGHVVLNGWRDADLITPAVNGDTKQVEISVAEVDEVDAMDIDVA